MFSKQNKALPLSNSLSKIIVGKKMLKMERRSI